MSPTPSILFHISWNQNSLDAYHFIIRLIKKYGKKPVYTDGTLWYVDACGWAELITSFRA
ncbi:MAG: hypothetical protein GU362_07185 [Thaumarchaeota archaeon]|nr:hypothetical protein [Nitrososphaerota archaeon]